MQFKSVWDEYVADASSMIKALGGASRDVKDSKKLKELLKIILALGNYMNGGQRGGAYGFKLNSLLKVKFLYSFIYLPLYAFCFCIAVVFCFDKK